MCCVFGFIQTYTFIARMVEIETLMKIMSLCLRDLLDDANTREPVYIIPDDCIDLFC